MTENLKNGKPAPPGIGGGDINQRDDIGATLLHEKAADEGAQTAAALIDAGADVNREDRTGDTPLDAAANNNHKGAMSALARFGARGGGVNDKIAPV